MSVFTIKVSEDLGESARRAIDDRASRITLDPGQGALALAPGAVALVVSGSTLLSNPEPDSACVRVGPGGFFAESCPGAPEIRLKVSIDEPTEVAILELAALPAGIREKVRREVLKQVLAVELGSTAIFRELEPDALTELSASSECLSLSRGDRLILEGEDADCFYVVLHGSLEVYRRKADSSMQVIAVLERGACVGEMALLMRDKRSASVRARRNSTVVKVHADSFEHLKRHASVVLHLSQVLSARLKQTTASAFPRPGIQTIALIPWCDEPSFDDFIRHFSQAFERAGDRVATLKPPASLSNDEFAALLERSSAEHPYVVCICGDDAPEWKTWAVPQADLIVCVGSLDAEPKRRLPPEAKEARNAGAYVELALLRGEHQTARGTVGWLHCGPFDAHHHLVSGKSADFDRLVRRITGKAWGLVLGGGGARGLAHIGVIRAFEESGIPIDMIGGSSMGAILAAQYATGLDSAQMLAVTRDAYTTGSSFSDMTLPFVAMRTGGGTIARLRSLFGERNIEDLPIPFFCATCNLTRATTVIQDRGPVALWTRVSCSVPGLLPPIAWNGDLLVDGALLDNLPVAAMREKMRGRIAASDVSVRVDLAVHPAMPPEPSWSGFAQIFRKLRGRPSLPNIGNVLMRTAEIGTIRDARLAARPADLYLHHPVDEFSMSDFEAIDRIVDLGYRYTAERLNEWKESQS